MYWHYSGPRVKSGPETTRFTELLQHFPASDVKDFDFARESKRLDKYLEDSANPLRADSGWIDSSVTLRLPCAKVKWASEEDAPPLIVEHVRHRKILDIVREVYEDEAIAPTLHTTPFEQFIQLEPGGLDERIYGKLYTSPAMLKAHAAISSPPRLPGDPDSCEYVVAPLLLGSDATHLAQFGDASLWPFYMRVGAESKYTLGKPSSHSCHHLAYIPSVSSLIASRLDLV